MREHWSTMCLFQVRTQFTSSAVRMSDMCVLVKFSALDVVTDVLSTKATINRYFSPWHQRLVFERKLQMLRLLKL